MSNKAARNLFIFGSLFFFVIFVMLTIDTMGKLDKRAPAITEEVNAGKMVWHKYDCIGCHTILGNGSYFAPDMTKITEKKPKDYLKQFLMDPKSVNPKASMPKLGISSKEADDLIAFLDWTSRVDTNGWPPKPILATAAGVAVKELTAGQRVYQSQNCANCHMISGIGGTTGPDLTHVGSKRDRTWLFGHFKDPKTYVPNSAMPSYGHIGEKELNDLTDYMVSLK
ncbi:MAG: cbb3-type cytochrome c oxidase subunit II [Thermodesulfovibrionales bacterium]|jgi:nitric oxide reductase subunit C|nr:cbb3-type cytochrome c oxidase subunit II [Thermodesulfovibrionales bacterium]